jgi:proteic killer suppression protein
VCKAAGYSKPSENASFVHKGLKRLFLEDEARGLAPDAAIKLRAMLTFLQDMQNPEKLRAFPLRKAHQLTGGRKGVGSPHVTRNWRLTFQIKDGEIVDMNYEDSHGGTRDADAEPRSSWPFLRTEIIEAHGLSVTERRKSRVCPAQPFPAL